MMREGKMGVEGGGAAKVGSGNHLAWPRPEREERGMFRFLLRQILLGSLLPFAPPQFQAKNTYCVHGGGVAVVEGGLKYFYQIGGV